MVNWEKYHDKSKKKGSKHREMSSSLRFCTEGRGGRYHTSQTLFDNRCKPDEGVLILWCSLWCTAVWCGVLWSFCVRAKPSWTKGLGGNLEPLVAGCRVLHFHMLTSAPLVFSKHPELLHIYNDSIMPCASFWHYDCFHGLNKKMIFTLDALPSLRFSNGLQ